MIRSIAFILLTFGIHSLSAQHKILHGIVIDKTSKEPVPYVHIFLTQGSSGTISDLYGEFSIVITSKDDSLRFTSIGYKTLKLPVNVFADKTHTVELEEDRVLLPGIIIHELSAKEFVRKCVTKIPNTYAQHESNSKAFYWNSVRHEDRYTGFYESYVHLKKNGSVHYDSTLISIEDSVKHIELFDSLQDIVSFDVVNQASMFVNPANLDDWKFEYLYSSEYPEGKFVVIEAVMIQNPFEKNKELNTLNIFIENSSYAIVRVDFSYQWQTGKRYRWQDDVMFSLSRLTGTVEYTKILNQKYGLTYLFIGAEFSFAKRFDPATLLKKAFINHELVILRTGTPNQKPVVRWSDYLDAVNQISSTKAVSEQD